MSCPNDPGKDYRRQEAKCHICGEIKSCGFCNLCCHWFCKECNPKVFARSIEAVKELVRGAKVGCCGITSDCESIGYGTETAD